MTVSIEIFLFRPDNYCVLVHDNATGATTSIDAIDASAITDALTRRNWTLTDIFITHHHWDHTDAIGPLKARFDVKVTGPAAEANAIEELDVLVRGGDCIQLGKTSFDIIDTPGHTNGHIAYYDALNKNLFCGDALFCLGCGRMFEGEPKSMWEGLKALRNLPDDTNVYCGHEYSAANAAFALSVDPDNGDLKQRARQINKLRKTQKATVPFNLGVDKRANPFLRADTAKMANNMNLEQSDPAQVFAAIRKAKDQF